MVYIMFELIIWRALCSSVSAMKFVVRISYFFKDWIRFFLVSDRFILIINIA